MFDFESLQMHGSGKSGKIAVATARPLITQWDLSLACSPGVAAAAQ